MTTTHTATPKACPLTETLILAMLRGTLFTLQCLCDRYHDTLSIEPEDFIGPNGYFASGLDRTPVKFHGERFELVWLADFQAFVDAGYVAGGAR